MKKIVVTIAVAVFSSFALKAQISEKTLLGKWIPQKVNMLGIEMNVQTDTSDFAADVRDLVLVIKKENKYSLGKTNPEEGNYAIKAKEGAIHIIFTDVKGGTNDMKVEIRDEMLVMEYPETEDGFGEMLPGIILYFKRER